MLGEQENMHTAYTYSKRTIKIGNWRIVPATLSGNSSLLDKLGVRKFTCWNMDMCSLELCAKIMKKWLHVLSQSLKHIITVSTASDMQWSAISGNRLLSLLAVGIHTKSRKALSWTIVHQTLFCPMLMLGFTESHFYNHIPTYNISLNIINIH